MKKFEEFSVNEKAKGDVFEEILDIVNKVQDLKKYEKPGVDKYIDNVIELLYAIRTKLS